MMHKTLVFAGALWALGCLAGQAAGGGETILPIDGAITRDGTAVDLSWFNATPPRVGSVTVKRRLYGQTGGESWQTIASGLGAVPQYLDDSTAPGIAYEYQVLREARDLIDVGYWLAGRNLPAQAQRGNAYVIVEQSIATALAPRLARFEQDLTGAGWQVQRFQSPRHLPKKPVITMENALVLRDWLRARYAEDPFGRHAVILVGHLPMVKSGRANPDGHKRVPHTTDLFYADMDGRWSITTRGLMLDNKVPGNFIEMQVGRIDFAPVSAGQKDTEIRLLRAYFDKNHHWRHARLGDLREAYGRNDHLFVERAGLRNIVGGQKITLGGHHDVGEEKPWLWGVDFGSYKGRDYAEKYANKAVFTINFGSGKQKIDAHFNPMTALLAQPWYTLAVGWGGRPAWWLHHMALGGSIGDVHLRTVNNGAAEKPYRDSMDYFPTGRYMMRNVVWVNLLGDPTLRAFPLAPPGAVTLQPGARLSWAASPDPDTIGYHVFRAPPDGTRFERLTGAEPLQTLSFTDQDPVPRARYMVRAYGLKEVQAGSFYTFSQGVEASPAPLSPAPAFELTTAVGQPVALPAAFNTVEAGVIHAIVEGPAQGQLAAGAEGWVYTPPAGFTGALRLRVSRSGSLPPAEGVLQIEVQ
jgi:hypothetical protein